MKVNGIVAEYNPFHNGHAYQLQHAKEANDANYTIIVMSGNFMQRGAPALLDKFTRTKMALENGADLVLELPTRYAASSAEFFAKGSVALFDKLGVTTNLCFGSECGNIEVLSRIAEISIRNRNLTWNPCAAICVRECPSPSPGPGRYCNTRLP